MSTSGAGSVLYKRARFSTRLPEDRRYTAAHYWLLEESQGIWRVGFTKFATRMLGDLVEYEVSLKAGAQVTVGQDIGQIEGFKAITALYSVAEGEFLGVSDGLTADITVVESDPYGSGWLYRVKGRPDPASIDVRGYIEVLDATIDRLLASRHETEQANDES